MALRAVSHQPSGDRWPSPPTTREGRWALGLASAAIVLGLLGEAARRGDVGGPFYPLAFLAALAGGGAAIVAVRRGERSLVVILAVLPLVVAAGFGLVELLGER